MNSVHRPSVTKAMSDAMTRFVGFEKLPGEGIFVARLDQDVLGWASQTTTRADGAIEVSPRVGVRHEPIHRMVDSLLGRQSHHEPTVSKSLGYLMPQQSANLVWRFDHGTDVAAQAADLAAAVGQYGRPYMLAHQTLDAIIETLKVNGPWEYSHQRIPVALLLSGRPTEAEAFVAAEIAKLAHRTDPRDLAAQEFRLFAERFRAETRLRC